MVSKILILATCVFAFVVSSSEARLRTGRAGSFRRLSFKDHDGQGRKNTWDGWSNVPLDEDENVGRNGGFEEEDEFVGQEQCDPTCQPGTTCGEVDPRATYSNGIKPASPNCLGNDGGCGGCADIGGCMANYGWGCGCC